MLRANRILASLMMLLVAGQARAQTPPKIATDKGNPQSKPAPTESSIPSSQATTAPPSEIHGKGLGLWAKDLENKDPAIRELAVRTIPYFGRSALAYIPKLIERLAIDKEYNVKFAALMVLSQNPIEDEKQRAQIVRHILNDDGLMHSTQVPMRTQVAIALMGYGKEARAAIDTLSGENYLKFQYSYELRMASAAALGSIGRADPSAKPPQLGPDIRAVIALVNQLNDPCLRVREEVAKAFMTLGRPVRPEDWIREKAILTDRIKAEPDAVLQSWLRAAVIRLDPSEWNNQIAAIASGLYSDKQDIRVASAQAIGMFGAASKDLVGHLIKSIRSVEKSAKQDDVDFLYMCVWAVGSIGPEAKKEKDAIPLLQKMTKHADKNVKETAEKALNLVNR